jgi:hypothetical protein
VRRTPSYLRVLFPLLATVFLASIAIGGTRLLHRESGPSDSTPTTKKPEAYGAPEEPPAASLVFPHRLGDSLQLGLLIHSDWTVNGQSQTYTVSTPFTWPAPAQTRSRLLIAIATTKRPSALKAKIYKKAGHDGVPRGPARLLLCSIDIPARTGCRTRLDPARSRWEVSLPLPETNSESFVVFYAIWFGNPFIGQGPAYEAAWGFHAVRRERGGAT